MGHYEYEEEEQGFILFEYIGAAVNFLLTPVFIVARFLARYGWCMVGLIALSCYIYHKLKPYYRRWQQAREDAEYHKDPDKLRSHNEAVQRARERQQQLLVEASMRALEKQKEMEELKKQKQAEALERYKAEQGGSRLGSDGDCLPLSRGGSGSSYKAPKRSACSGGGCGR